VLRDPVEREKYFEACQEYLNWKACEERRLHTRIEAELAALYTEPLGNN